MAFPDTPGFFVVAFTVRTDAVFCEPATDNTAAKWLANDVIFTIAT